MITTEHTKERRRRLMLRTLALLLVFSGCVMFLGWRGALPWQASASAAPMARSTALFFLAFGVVIFVAEWYPTGIWWRRVLAAFSMTSGLLALALIFLYLKKIHPAIEHFVPTTHRHADGIPLGHMTPFTAAGFILAAGSLFLVSREPRNQVWPRLYGWWSASLLLLLSIVLVIAHALGIYLFFAPPFPPPSLLTSLAFMELAVVLCLLAGPPAGLSFRQSNLPSRQGHIFVLAFLIVAVSMSSAGYGYYRRYEQQAQKKTEETLKSIADLKIDELQRWRKERIDDGYMLSSAPFFANIVKRLTEHRADQSDRQAIEDWLVEIVRHSVYDEAAVLREDGVVELGASSQTFHTVSPEVIQKIPEVITLGWPAIVDFYQGDDDGEIYLTVLSPFTSPLGSQSPPMVLALWVHSEDFVYPFLAHWPVPSRSAETLLVRRDGDEVVALNPLRFDQSAPLKKRMPMSETELPAVQAILGYRGIVEGQDYRATKVLAAVNAVPESPWFLISKIDEAEIYAPIRERLWLVVSSVGVMLTVAALLVWFVWRQQRVRFYRGQYEASKALTENRERFELVLRSIQVGVWRWDIPENKRYFDAQVCQLLGINPQSFSGTTEEFLQAIHPEDQESVQAALASAVDEGIPYESGYRVIWPDGSVHHINARGRLLLDESGRPLSVDGVVWDVTERQEMEDALRESERRFRTLFNTMTEGVALHELVTNTAGEAVDYRILMVNPAFEKHTDISAEKACGPLASVLYATNPPPFFEQYLHVTQTGEPVSFESYFPAMSKHFRVSVVSPSANYFATVFEDISDRVRMEHELLDRNEELTRFIYTVSHDLKSPLVTVKTFLSYVVEDIKKQDEERLGKDIGFIRNAADKMTLLLDELLELSRVGRQKNPTGDFSLQDLAAEALALVAGRLRARGIETHVTSRPIVLHGDRQRLIEVFQNLVDNAAKFMGDQPVPRLEIGAEDTAAGIVIFVRDNGVGIDPRHQSKLFGLFEKLHADTEGTGMGLALARRIIEVHGGRIWVESEGVGHGTTFRFLIPDTREQVA